VDAAESEVTLLKGNIDVFVAEQAGNTARRDAKPALMAPQIAITC
jgi:hypothetical protein